MNIERLLLSQQNKKPFTKLGNMTLPLPEYDKVVRKFVKDYVDNLTPDQMRNHLSEQFHIDLENIRQDMGQDEVFLEMVNWDSDLYDQIAQDFDLPEDL